MGELSSENALLCVVISLDLDNGRGVGDAYSRSLSSSSENNRDRGAEGASAFDSPSAPPLPASAEVVRVIVDEALAAVVVMLSDAARIVSIPRLALWGALPVGLAAADGFACTKSGTSTTSLFGSLGSDDGKWG